MTICQNLYSIIRLASTPQNSHTTAILGTRPIGSRRNYCVGFRQTDAETSLPSNITGTSDCAVGKEWGREVGVEGNTSAHHKIYYLEERGERGTDMKIESELDWSDSFTELQ